MLDVRHSILTATAVMALLGATSAAAQQAPSTASVTRESLMLSTGVDYSSGSYGLPSNTTILVVPFALRAKLGDFAFTGSIPYLRINGSGVVVGPDGKPIPGVPTSGGTRSGLGDVTLGAEYYVPSEQLGGLDLGIGGRVKIPTASKSKQLTTGKTDETVFLDASYTMGTVSPFVNLGYRFLGSPSGVNLRNGPTASIGSTFLLGKTILIASYDYARATTATTKDAHDIFGGITVPATKRLMITGYGSAGLSSGAADYDVGLLLSVKAL
jgi:hypothetical protein